MKKIKFPSTTVLFFAGLGSFGIADIANPSFIAIGIIIFSLIPVLIIDLLYSEPEIDKLLVPRESIATEEPILDNIVRHE